MRDLVTRNNFRIVTEETEIRKRAHASKRYIVYPETFQGGRIWTLTCDERLALGEVRIGKWCWDVSLPLIQIIA